MTGKDTPKDVRSRNRGQTETAILEGAKALLSEEGFQALGVNAVARRAGCDKQLIYRYFGGLDGLVEAIGGDLASWLQDGVPPVAQPATYAELMECMALAFLDALRANPLVQKIAAWELSEPSPLVVKLAEARAGSLARWIGAIRGDLLPPANVDAPAINAVVIAAIQHLVLSGATTGMFAGVALREEADWDRVRKVIARMVRSAYA
ncbi:MAG: TetR/AcrR family transcriptional regulator [Novosphingobium sp.]|uniref:TetR/AcrR family transcriptional regulator n=1 Tax=Novosphingobium sp. TaxID=1874826 RepID=UPI00301B2651